MSTKRKNSCPQKMIFLSPKNKKHLNLNFLTTACVKHLDFMTTFHNFTLKKETAQGTRVFKPI